MDHVVTLSPASALNNNNNNMDMIKSAKKAKLSATNSNNNNNNNMDAVVPEMTAADSAECFPEVPLNHKDACRSYTDYAASRIATVMVERAPLVPTDASYAEFKNEPTHIPLATYMRRILKLAKAEASCALAAIVYIERMLAMAPALEVSNNNVRRLVFVAMMVASKSLTDIPFSNKYWAAISGTYHITALNRMERDMIGLLEWDVHIDRDTFAPLHAAAFADA